MHAAPSSVTHSHVAAWLTQLFTVGKSMERLVLCVHTYACTCTMRSPKETKVPVQDGVVDECGVCGGLSTSCSISVIAQLQTTETASAINQTLQVRWPLTFGGVAAACLCTAEQSTVSKACVRWHVLQVCYQHMAVQLTCNNSSYSGICSIAGLCD